MICASHTMDRRAVFLIHLSRYQAAADRGHAEAAGQGRARRAPLRHVREGRLGHASRKSIGMPS